VSIREIGWVWKGRLEERKGKGGACTVHELSHNKGERSVEKVKFRGIK